MRSITRGTSGIAGAAVMAVLMSSCAGSEAGEATDPLAQPPVQVTGPDVRIGSLDDPDYAFRSVLRLGEGPDGLVYSLHLGEAMIRRWTPDGVTAGQIGREGDGPGEFRRPNAFGFFGDSLWVLDLSGLRVSYFDLDGGLLSIEQPEPAGGDGRARPMSPFRDRTYLGRGLASVQRVQSGELTESEVQWQNGAGEKLGTLETVPHSPNDLVRLDVEGGFPYAPQLIPDFPLIEAEDTSVVRVDRFPWDGEGQPAVVVHRVARSGDTLAIGHIPYEPIPLDEARFDALVDERVDELFEVMQTVRSDLSRDQLERAYREGTFRPEYVPPLESMVVADDGSVWLQPAAPGDEVVWWALDPDMRPLGRIATPPGFTLIAVHDDRLWGVERDDFDVEYIVRYRYERFTP